MRRMILVAVSAIAALALCAPALADVARYQNTTATLTANVNNGAYLHVYTITISPCDNSFVGSGGIGSMGLKESVSGTLADSNRTIDFNGVYLGAFAPYAWRYRGPLAAGTGNGPGGQSFAVAFTLDVTATSDWKNHGQYVKAQGGGSDSAHSCIGMPIPFSWSQSGTIDSTSMSGTTTSLPIDGKYRIDVSGDWSNAPWSPLRLDAEYVSADDWSTRTNGPIGFAEADGDLQVNGLFVDWGAYSASHSYTLTTTLAGGTVNLAVFEGYEQTNTKEAQWYGDNSGTLSYTITYVGP